MYRHLVNRQRYQNRTLLQEAGGDEKAGRERRGRLHALRVGRPKGTEARPDGCQCTQVLRVLTTMCSAKRVVIRC